MAWSERFTKTDTPTLNQIDDYIGSPLWRELCGFIEARYGAVPKIEYSICSGARGWNVKYRSGGRALCTLYPHEGYFTCLVCIGPKESSEAELLLTICQPYTQELYQKSGALNGTRWMMIDVVSEDVLADVKKLLFVRVKPKL